MMWNGSGEKEESEIRGVEGECGCVRISGLFDVSVSSVCLV